MKMHGWILLLAVLSLSACGVDVATTAATVGTLEAENAKQAKQQQERIEKKLEETRQLADQRLQALDGETSGNAPSDATQ